MLENLEHQEFLVSWLSTHHSIKNVSFIISKVQKVKEDHLDLQVIRDYQELRVKKEKEDFLVYQVHQD